jgi:predicted O-linked N-acetylglucosamine transferase (SPINDLY family)
MVQKFKQFNIPFLKPKRSLVGSVDGALPNIQDAIGLHQKGQLVQAQAIYQQFLVINPENADVIHLLGVIAHQMGQHQAAFDLIAQAIKFNSKEASYHSNHGIVLQKLGKLADAVDSFDKAIALKPDYVEAYSNRGVAMQELKQFDAAVASYDKAIALKPDYAEAYYNRGVVLQEFNQFDAAVASFDKAIALKPNYAEAYSNRGVAFQALKQLDAAMASFDKAIALKPDYAVAYCNRGGTLLELKQFDVAVASCYTAIALKPDYASAYCNRGIALQELKQFDAAVASYDKAIELKPDYEYLLGIRHHAKMLMCDWQGFAQNVHELNQKIQRNEKASPCFPALSLPISLKDQHTVTEIWSKNKYPKNVSLGPIPKISRQSKICIAYYSGDFKDHPVSILTVGLFESHERAKFESIAFSFGPDSQDDYRSRLTNAFDKFIDVKGKSDREIAELSRSLGVDIAIDLGGYTGDCRVGIFSYRAAPIQISYIGYLGTMGADYYDYLIADRTLIPIESQVYYSEKIVYLPSYQVNDDKQEIPNVAINRQELNLPINGFVFCCFNANYKITPSTFDGWMRILKAVPDSVLLLYSGIQSAADNLKLEAEKRGVSQNRLIFGKKITRSQYMARFRSADLFLDTLPYNAGATASDALWAGLPVLTCMGEAFASRYAASLLFAIGLPELVTQTQDEFESLAIELATNSIKLKEIKDKLESNRLTTPLFDTLRFTKNMEAAYIKMYEQYLGGVLPDHIYIEEIEHINPSSN